MQIVHVEWMCVESGSAVPFVGGRLSFLRCKIPFFVAMFAVFLRIPPDKAGPPLDGLESLGENNKSNNFTATTETRVFEISIYCVYVSLCGSLHVLTVEVF